MPVPCGKCIECTKRKQNDYAFILSQHSKTHSKLDLVTLTYRNDAIPFSGVFELIDPNGQVVDKSGLFWLKDEFHEKVVREYYSGFAPSGHQLEVPFEYFDGLEDFEVVHKTGTYNKDFHIDLVYSPKSVYSHAVFRVPDGYSVRSVLTASLRRNDVKLCIKNARIRFRRQYGYNAEFTYFEVGEYGSKRSRPHYHIIFFDAPDEFLAIFRELWFRDYGTSDHEPVTARGTDDLATAYEKVSRYLSKYLTKGSFEKWFVRHGYVQKPRRISSKGIAHDQLPKLRRYILAYDVFGEYDPDRPPKVVRDNIALIAERRYYSITKNGQEFRVRIPKVLYEKCLSRTYGMSREQKAALGFSSSRTEEYVTFNCTYKGEDHQFTFSKYEYQKITNQSVPDFTNVVKVLEGIRQVEAPVLARVSHQRSALSRLVASYAQERAQDLLRQVVFQASSGKCVRPSSIRFRMAYAQISASTEQVRAQNAKVCWQQLRNFYSRSVD